MKKVYILISALNHLDQETSFGLGNFLLMTRNNIGVKNQ